MLPNLYGARLPKSRSAIDDAIYNGAPAPFEVLKYQYRKLFHLSARQLAEEPVDELFTNLYIYAQIKEKERMDIEHAKHR